MQLLVMRICKDLPIPARQTFHSSGFDLYSADDTTIDPGSIALIHTGIKVIVPIDYELQIRPRSGLALKQGITVLNTPGTVDADYRGEVGVILINHGKTPFVVRKGDRIAQGVITPVMLIDPVEISEEEYNSYETDRGGLS